MRRSLVALALLAASGYGGPVTITGTSTTTSPASAARAAETPSPQPPGKPSPGVLAITSGADGTVSLIGAGGTTVARANSSPASFRPNAWAPWTSASLTRVYYLNSGSEVRYLAPDGSTGLVTRLTVQPNQEVGFAVSPDDKRIAVSVFSHAQPPAAAVSGIQPSYNGMRLFVEDLVGGGNLVDIFSSPTVAEYPIGWSAGRLVLAVSQPVCCQNPPTNPYAAGSYHVANPANRDRLITICGPGDIPAGPVEPVGIMCWPTNGNGPYYVHWDGTLFPPPAAVPAPGRYLDALSPDGQLAAVGQDVISIWGPRGSSQNLKVSGYVFGWLDQDHLVIQKSGASTLSILDLRTSSTTELPQATSYLGTFPAALS